MHTRKAVALAVFAPLCGIRRHGPELGPRASAARRRLLLQGHELPRRLRVESGGELSRVPEDMNDKVSSLRVFGRAEVIVFKDIRFDGGSSRFDFDVRNPKTRAERPDFIDACPVRRLQNRRSSSGYGGNRSRPLTVIRRAYQTASA
jgi:hypothetical protein